MTALSRVEKLVEAARRLADPSDDLGRRARAILPVSTGLSPENVELGLSECLETHPSRQELESLCAFVAEAPRVWVGLAANVFVAPLRAIALALAQSEDVRVRPSRREPEFCRLLREASATFDLVDSLEPEPGDSVWLYGSDESIAEVRKSFAAEAIVHAHGSGLGIAVVSTDNVDMARVARALASDVVPFDQRGCLSPRIAFAIGDESAARAFARELAAELRAAEQRIPLGALSAEESAEITRFRDTMRYGGELLPAGRGFVSVGQSWVVPPAGRNVAVIHSVDFPTAPAHLIAAVGLDGNDALDAWASETFPRARRSRIGRMQRPAFDGPVDLRPCSSREIV